MPQGVHFLDPKPHGLVKSLGQRLHAVGQKQAAFIAGFATGLAPCYGRKKTGGKQDEQREGLNKLRLEAAREHAHDASCGWHDEKMTMVLYVDCV